MVYINKNSKSIVDDFINFLINGNVNDVRLALDTLIHDKKISYEGITIYLEDKYIAGDEFVLALSSVKTFRRKLC